MEDKALVGVIMGSHSDWDVMQHCCATLDKLGIANEARVYSAHRTPEQAIGYARDAVENGIGKANDTVNNITGAWVKEMKVDCEDGKITDYRVTMKVTFVLKD